MCATRASFSHNMTWGNASCFNSHWHICLWKQRSRQSSVVRTYKCSELKFEYYLCKLSALINLLSHSNWWHFYVNNIGFVWKQNSRDLINYFCFFFVFGVSRRERTGIYRNEKRRLWKVIKWNRNRRNCFLFEFNFNEIHHFSSFFYFCECIYD